MEEWRDVKGYEGRYEVSSFGNIKSLISGGKIMKPNFVGRGYATVELFNGHKGQRILIHRIVAKAFIPNPNNHPIINHIDENKTNNCMDNLEWCTYSHNSRHGTMQQRRMAGTDYGTALRKEIAIKNGKMACKPIVQIGKNFITEWDSAKQASSTLKINASHIAETCKGKRSSAGGFDWKYKRGSDLSESRS